MAKNCRLCCLIFCLCGIFCAAQRSWGGDAGVAVHIHTSKQTYEAGEPIDLLADTAASRDTSLMETHTNCLFEYDFDVVLPNKDPAPLTVYGKWLKAGNAYSGVLPGGPVIFRSSDMEGWSGPSFTAAFVFALGLPAFLGAVATLAYAWLRRFGAAISLIYILLCVAWSVIFVFGPALIWSTWWRSAKWTSLLAPPFVTILVTCIISVRRALKRRIRGFPVIPATTPEK